MNENQEIKRTSKSHLKALVKKGREQAQKEKEADDRDRAERAIRRKTRQGSNYDPSEDDLEDSYSPEGGESVEHLDELIMPEKGKSGAYKSGKIRTAYDKGSKRIAKKYRSNILAAHADKRADRANERGERAEGPLTKILNKRADERAKRKEQKRIGKIGAGPRTRNPVNSSYEPEGEETLNEKDYGHLIKKGVEQAKEKRVGKYYARQVTHPNIAKELKGKDAEGKTVVVKSSYEPEGETTLSELKKSTLQSYVRKVSYKNPETGRGAVKPGRGKGYTKAQERLTAKNAQELGYDGPNIRKQASKVQDSYSPEGETTLSEVDSSTTEFVDRVMNRVNEGFDKMPERQLKDYDKKAKKPMHGRKASKEEREEMAAKFQKSGGGASTKTKKMRDLRLKAK